MSNPTLANHVVVLVHRLGGPSAVAIWCGSHISADAVTAWGLRNTIPWRWRTRVTAMARARGIRLSAKEQKITSLDFPQQGERDRGLRLAIEAAGSMGKLGKTLGISAQAIQQWREVPAERIIAIEKVTGIPRERLRPDLFRREGEAVS